MNYAKRAYGLRISIVFIIGFLISCNNNNNNNLSDNSAQKSLTLLKIAESGKLTAFIDYNSVDYFIYRGRPMGYQYEILRDFADYLGVKLELIVENNARNAIRRLQEGEGDLIASELAVSLTRNQAIGFTRPVGTSRLVLVQQKAAPANETNHIRQPLQLAGQTVHLPNDGFMIRRMQNLMEEIGDSIRLVVNPGKTQEELISAVDQGEIKYAVVDERIARIGALYHPKADMSLPVSFHHNVAWAVRNQDHDFRVVIDEWLGNFQTSRKAKSLAFKYFESNRIGQMAVSGFHSHKGGRISSFDATFRHYSRNIGWDWRLLASLAFQESQFHPEAKSWAGAMGIMQLMPETAGKYGVDSLSSPEEHIRAGASYLKWLEDQWKDKIPSESERIKFVIASYNVGIGHVLDARRLAVKYNRDPNIWDDNVAYFLARKAHPDYYNDAVVYYGYCRGEEPVRFVTEIFERYGHYQKLVKI